LFDFLASSSSVELEKLNIRQFLFFCKHVQPILENYALIYDLMSEEVGLDETSARTISFTNEKEFIKRVQTTAFDRMLTASKSNWSKLTTGSFDFELLSLNLINNSVLALKQFSVLSAASRGGRNEIDRAGLIVLYRKLKSVLDVLRPRLNELIRFSRSIERNDDDQRDFCFHEESSIVENDRGALFLSEYQDSFHQKHPIISSKI
jgi:hypothetical protein